MQYSMLYLDFSLCTVEVIWPWLEQKSIVPPKRSSYAKLSGRLVHWWLSYTHPLSEEPNFDVPLLNSTSCFHKKLNNFISIRIFIGLDNSGLSDPFAKIFVCDRCRKTQVNIVWTDHVYHLMLHINLLYIGNWWDLVPHLGWAAGIWEDCGPWKDGGHQESSSSGYHWDLWLWQGNIWKYPIHTFILFYFSSTKQSLLVEHFPHQLFI